MSLRTEIRQAVDEVTPPAPALETTVDAFVRAQARTKGRTRPRTRHWRSFMRGSLALVAVLAVIALVMGVFVGGRLIQDWNALHKAVPAGKAQVTVADLEARPLLLPDVPQGATCPEHPGVNKYGFDYGDGPVYANGGNVITTPWGHLYDVTYLTQPGLQGPILVRGRDLQSTLVTGFLSADAVGPVVGVDSTQNPSTLRGELVLDPSKPPAKYNGFGDFAVRQGLAMGWKGCYGFQIDGPGFTEIITGFDQSYAATS